MFLKAFQLITLLAVANPFCCCAKAYLDQAMKSTEASPACCGTMPTEQNELPDDDNGHPDKCPHQETKVHQQATQQDIVGLEVDAHYAPIAIAELSVDDSFAQTGHCHHRVSPETASTIQPPGLQEVYCVYRI